MQAFHFEDFVVNYGTLISLIILIRLFWNPVPRRVLIWTAGLTFAWGMIAVGLPARLALVPIAVANDQNIPVLLRLKQLSVQDGTVSDLRTKGQTSTLVFSPSTAMIRLLPTWTSQGTLLDLTGVDCRGLTRAERKRLFYMHLYYSKTEIAALGAVLRGAPYESHDELSSARSFLFGHERVFPALTTQFKPIREEEVADEVAAYQRYSDSFSLEEVLHRPIKYAVIPGNRTFDFTNLDRWYERDQGERVGPHTLYRLKLRN